VAEHFDGGVPGGGVIEAIQRVGVNRAKAAEAVEYLLFGHDAYLFGVLWER
jgi:hypothetical protein